MISEVEMESAQTRHENFQKEHYWMAIVDSSF